MSSSLITLIVVALVCLLTGAVAGFLMGSMNGGDSPESGKEAPEAPAGGSKGKYLPIARLWREKNSQMLVIEMGEKSFVAPDPLDPSQRELINQAAVDLARWTGVSVGAERASVVPAAAQPAQEPVPAPAKTKPTDSVIYVPPAEPVKPASEPETVKPAPVVAENEVPPAPVVPPSQRRVTTGPLTPKPIPGMPMSVVAQIDEVLQEMVAGTPYAAYGLKLAEDPRRGVMVWVGASCYEGIDSVPDKEIQKLLRSAAAEWERRQDEAKLNR